MVGRESVPRQALSSMKEEERGEELCVWGLDGVEPVEVQII